MKSFQLILTALVFPFSFCVAGVPVIPLPQHVEEIPEKIVCSGHISFDPEGAVKKVCLELASHWKSYVDSGEFVQSGPVPVQSVRVGILGNNRQFDRLVSGQAGQWMSRIGDQGYILILRRKERVLAARTPTGLFYGMQTLRQLTRTGWNREVMIADWPDLPSRVIFDDISRGPVSTVSYVKTQIRRLAELKINYLSFYIENVVQPESYPDFAPWNGKFTTKQIRELSDYASGYHVQLIGNFQSFGHFEKILSLPQYRSMGETSTLISPLDAGAKQFLAGVTGELCDAFSAPYFNIDCDETWDLERGRSKAYVKKVGPAAFYAGHIRFLHDVISRKKKQVMMWGDIALRYDSILDLLPRDIIYLTWEYGARTDYSRWIEPFRKRGLPFMVCPGILNSNRMIPDYPVTRQNIREFIRCGKEAGALGAFTTVWDDGGTGLFSNDWYGVALAAENSWHPGISADSDLDARIDRTVYGITSGSYTAALHQLTKLDELSSTRELSNAVWTRKLLPAKGEKMILEISDMPEALRIAQKADSLLAMTRGKWHHTDLKALQLIIDQYRLILACRLKMADIAGWYDKACRLQMNDRPAARALLIKARQCVSAYKSRFMALSGNFQTAWLQEDQLHGLATALGPFREKIKALNRLEQDLLDGIGLLDTNQYLLPPNRICLDVEVNTSRYFHDWLLCGPFPIADLNHLPGFLYGTGTDREGQAFPVPGKSFPYQGRSYSWKKYSGGTGAMISLADYYDHAEKSAACAYCSVKAERDTTVRAFIGSNDGIRVFCNGKLIYSNLKRKPFILDETAIDLPLKQGMNHLLLKISQWKGDWGFSFRLEDHCRVSNHKYKYVVTLKDQGS